MSVLVIHMFFLNPGYWVLKDFIASLANMIGPDESIIMIVMYHLPVFCPIPKTVLKTGLMHTASRHTIHFRGRWVGFLMDMTTPIILWILSPAKNCKKSRKEVTWRLHGKTPNALYKYPCWTAKVIFFSLSIFQTPPPRNRIFGKIYSLYEEIWRRRRFSQI